MAHRERRRGLGAAWATPSAALLLCLCLCGFPAAHAEPEDHGAVRVGTSADYRPFSVAAEADGELEGFDVVLLRAWAAERKRALVWVRFRWPKLLENLAAERFDLAASGITVRPERSAAGRFSVPVAETSPWVLARTPERWAGLASLDRPQIRIAVNAGGHLERVARQHFPRASLLAVPDNAAVLELLLDESVHAVVTDSVEAPHWQARAKIPLARLGPLARDRKAWLVHPERPELARDLDSWLLAREADGSLGRWRAEWLGEEAAATAEPLAALLAALDERLALMPLVGFVKRRDGLALEVPERESRVIDAALEALHEAARLAEREAPPDASVRALFRAQMDAAKQVQWRAVKDPSYEPTELPDLETALRPGLLRIGARVARLLLELPPGLEASTVRIVAREALRAPYLDDTLRDSLADAIAACTASAEPAREAAGLAPLAPRAVRGTRGG